MASDISQFEVDTSPKVIADSSNTEAAVPSKFNFTNERTALTSDSLPVVDFSALTRADPDQRSRAVRDLDRACREWGFFILVNHGIPAALMSEMFRLMKEFFSLPDSEKKQYEGSALDPIKCMDFKAVNTSSQSYNLWRAYLNLHVHPKFHCPQQPLLFREAVQEYSEMTRKIARKLIEGVCDALELDPTYMEETLKMDSSFQMLTTNYYPSCPHPDQVFGITPHTDPGLFTILIHNGVAGLQIEHDGKWYNADSPSGSILVNAADQLEILSNGRYESVMHRAMVNEERDRISIVVANGPSAEAVVGPAAAVVEKDGRSLYNSMKYKDYLESRITKPRPGQKSLLEQQMIMKDD